MSPRRNGVRVFPDGKAFAFTILDDTDDATVSNLKPIYSLLAELGYRTTKTVWPLPCPEGSQLFFAGQTLADPGYIEFCKDLVTKGFEITWHCATMESSARERTIEGLETFREIFGTYPTIHANHATNRENVYWGAERYRTPVIRQLARLWLRQSYGGVDPESPFFWGDLCRKHFRFVRNFAFSRINTLTAASHMPYRLADTPYVRSWFSTSDAPDVAAFRTLFTRENIDRLHLEQGVCILSTHLGKGFVTNGRVDPFVEEALRYIATLPGWFAPVSETLSYLADGHEPHLLGGFALARLEASHIIDRIRRRA